LVQNSDKERFGGYTSLFFKFSEEREDIKGGYNILFSLDKMKIYHQEYNSRSIRNADNTRGPMFGENCDLVINDDCN
jgi:hypothetical protein